MLIPEHHFDVWSIDFISGLSSSKDYNTIYIFSSKFTKFIQLTHCFKCKLALSVPESANLFFSNIVRLFGVPKMVLHNHDSRFTSILWKALWELLETKVIFTSTYHPQMDGQVKREHHTIEQSLRCYLIKLNLEQSKWVELLPFFEFAINASVQDSSELSPQKTGVWLGIVGSS